MNIFPEYCLHCIQFSVQIFGSVSISLHSSLFYENTDFDIWDTETRSEQNFEQS